VVRLETLQYRILSIHPAQTPQKYRVFANREEKPGARPTTDFRLENMTNIRDHINTQVGV
jgi:hypothetical protein